MELVLARFQRTNPPTFAATEGGAKAEAWLVQMEELFDTLEYAPEKRLKLAVLQLWDDAQRWCCRRDQSPVVTFVLPYPATTAGAHPTGPPPGPGGSNVTDLASNRDLTREIWSLQVDAPAILRRHDHLLVFAFFSHIRPPLPEPFRLDHPQVQAVLTRPTTAPTELARRRTNAGKETHATCTNTHCAVCDIKPLVRPQFHYFEPRKDTTRTTMNHLTMSQDPSSSP
ncbi:putative leucine-rich repeat receptor-like protein kinase [Dorcoceras hygrometricum]|uniref:Putative leucine-rich repeat receptor-like protein kinase n=1 Tax=Dorcoceras hygrometricum TaxID=472368 RepID=A0A2Z7AQ25_9LAMI|nr:putative leucine-rich repeat receptor-like protein kinase [Dorcoceras hygrometricum]